MDKRINLVNILKNQPWARDVTIKDESIKVQVSAEDSYLIPDILVSNNIRVFSIIPRTSLEDYYISLIHSKDKSI